MWIQVRTMDGKVTHTVDSLSRLTKVEELRKKIQALFHVEPGLQRLFYRGKQVKPPYSLPTLPAPLFLSRPGIGSWRPPVYTHSSLVLSASHLHRKLKCLSQEQRLNSKTDIQGKQLALESVAFGLLHSLFIFFLKPLSKYCRIIGDS